MIMPDLPTLAFIVSLSTSQPMSKIKEKNVTLNPACRMLGRDGGQAIMPSFQYSNILIAEQCGAKFEKEIYNDSF